MSTVFREMPTSPKPTRIDSSEDHRRAVEQLQELENTGRDPHAEEQRAALLAAIHDYERRLEEQDHDKGHPPVDKRPPGGRKR
jgi:hypothetical protein